MNKIAAAVFTTMIRAYQLAARPLLVGGCRFVPTCSEYAVEAIDRYGPWSGAWMAIKRICRCRPGCAGGFDPVP